MPLQKCDCHKNLGSQELFDMQMDKTLKYPTENKEFFGMTYLYHADAMTFPNPEYGKIKTPFLVITGALYTIKNSSNAFVAKAHTVKANISYFLVSDMDHYVRRRPDVITKTFRWLKEQLRQKS